MPTLLLLGGVRASACCWRWSAGCWSSWSAASRGPRGRQAAARRGRRGLRGAGRGARRGRARGVRRGARRRWRPRCAEPPFGPRRRPQGRLRAASSTGRRRPTAGCRCGAAALAIGRITPHDDEEARHERDPGHPAGLGRRRRRRCARPGEAPVRRRSGWRARRALTGDGELGRRAPPRGTPSTAGAASAENVADLAAPRRPGRGPRPAARPTSGSATASRRRRPARSTRRCVGHDLSRGTSALHPKRREPSASPREDEPVRELVHGSSRRPQLDAAREPVVAAAGRDRRRRRARAP